MGVSEWEKEGELFGGHNPTHPTLPINALEPWAGY